MKKTSGLLKASSIELIDRLLRRLRPRKRQIVLRPVGKVYHLEEIRDSINAEYFDTSLELPITWFGSGVIPKASILFGSYAYDNQLVKVNRAVDSEDIPLFFVRYIVFHEMLHHLHPPRRGKGGRWEIHHEAFKGQERRFKEFKEAKGFLKAWRLKNLKS